MSIELFIHRPIMTTLVMFAILLFGVMGYRLLPVSDLPNVDYPTIQVTARLPGGSPNTMASTVATPLEQQFATIAGIDQMVSVSALGITQITITFNLDRNLDGAALDVQAAITQASGFLPPGLPTPPTFQKVNPADQPILTLAVTSPSLPLYKLDDYAEVMIGEQISMLEGVSEVDVHGSQKYAVRIRVSPNRMAINKIGIDDVQKAIASANVNLPTGTLYGPNQAYLLQANGQAMEASQYLPIIIAERNGHPVRLQDIGTAVDGVENDKVAASYYNSKTHQRAIILSVLRQPGSNTVAVVNSITRLLPAFRERLPASADLQVLYDRSQTIRDSINDVQFTLILTISLVVLVIFLFLRNLYATIIPSLAIPFSIIGTFAVMYLMNYSLDNLSLMALTLSVGFVVDNTIVMLENIVRHIEMGESALEASLKGSKEVGFTILSMTISLTSVFIPILFMGGMLGRLFHEFAVTIASAILVSGFVSLTLTPMLCSRFLKSHAMEHHGRLYLIFEHGFESLLRGYEWSLQWALNYRKTVLGLSFLMLLVTAYLFMIISKGFIPEEDINKIIAYTETAQGISFDGMVQKQREVCSIIQQDPNVDVFYSSMGLRKSAANAMNVGRLSITLKQKTKRVPYPGTKTLPSVSDVIQTLRVKLNSLPGIRVYLQNPPSIQIGGQVTKGLYQLTLQGPNTNELYQRSAELTEKMMGMPELQGVNSDLQMQNPVMNIDIDRDKALTLGISPQAIEDALDSAYAYRQISLIYAPQNQYQVILELDPKYANDPSNLSLLYVHSNTGSLVPLSTVTKLTPATGALLVNHTGQLPSVTISFNLKPGVALGDAVDKIQALTKSIIPPTINTTFVGATQAFQSSIQGLGLLLIMAIMVIYIVLGILYESYIHPITILAGLPSAAIGALLTLLIFHVDLNIYAFVGIIMLIGLVMKNAIMIIDFALEAQRIEGLLPTDAVYEGCLVRFRPIMMTTMAALMGTLPIALGIGAGAESRRPLGLAIVGGLIFSQFVTLYITPVFYIYMEKVGKFLDKEEHRMEPAQEQQLELDIKGINPSHSLPKD